MDSPNYHDDPVYYKQLISKINDTVNFPVYLHQKGYELVQTSVGSMEFKNETDRIVLRADRDPMTYFNRNDSLDKGRFFKFLMHRSPNFYDAVQAGLEIIGMDPELLRKTTIIKKTRTLTTSLEKNYNIVPLRNSSYLRVHRGISQSTLNSMLFKGRIFNAYHIRDNGGKIANIAFPRYDLAEKPKNYILYNKPYRSRKDYEIKRFRLVVNKKDDCLFYSKPISKPSNIVFGESAIDLLSYHELHGRPNNFYVSFGGNIYDKKLEFFTKLIEPMTKTKEIELISIMDNDLKGQEFDIRVFSALINRYNPNITIETSYTPEGISLNIQYSDKVSASLDHHAAILEEKLSQVKTEKPSINESKCFESPKNLQLEFPMNGIAVSVRQKPETAEILLRTINALYLPFSTNIHKSMGKDWNDDLREYKEKKNKALKTTVNNLMPSP